MIRPSIVQSGSDCCSNTSVFIHCLTNISNHSLSLIYFLCILMESFFYPSKIKIVGFVHLLVDIKTISFSFHFIAAFRHFYPPRSSFSSFFSHHSSSFAGFTFLHSFTVIPHFDILHFSLVFLPNHQFLDRSFTFHFFLIHLDFLLFLSVLTFPHAFFLIGPPNLLLLVLIFLFMFFFIWVPYHFVGFNFAFTFFHSFSLFRCRSLFFLFTFFSFVLLPSLPVLLLPSRFSHSFSFSPCYLTFALTFFSFVFLLPLWSNFPLYVSLIHFPSPFVSLTFSLTFFLIRFLLLLLVLLCLNIFLIRFPSPFSYFCLPVFLIRFPSPLEGLTFAFPFFLIRFPSAFVGLTFPLTFVSFIFVFLQSFTFCLPSYFCHNVFFSFVFLRSLPVLFCLPVFLICFPSAFVGLNFSFMFLSFVFFFLFASFSPLPVFLIHFVFLLSFQCPSFPVRIFLIHSVFLLPLPTFSLPLQFFDFYLSFLLPFPNLILFPFMSFISLTFALTFFSSVFLLTLLLLLLPSRFSHSFSFWLC
ncbi:unnamed protein product [Acanthosepion pharaonis]|uniref:Uncharacterized protein n=1 Tax=Acanthosepion pharaonis TaxID=158019 RepID=A0A812AZ41_ACAPH|nr:unnamed protein product [Sepia pharaonis]